MLEFPRKIIVIDGLIGAGKTTFAKALKSTITSLLQTGDDERFALDGGKAFHLPIGTEWGTRYSQAVSLQDELPQVVLKRVLESYKDPKPDTFYAAQMAVQVGRYADRYSVPPAIFIIQDRAVFSDSAFIWAQKSQLLITSGMAGSLITHQQKSCEKWMEFFHAKDGADLVSIYIDTPIDTCIQRISARAREGEQSAVSSIYLEQLRDNGGHPSSSSIVLQHPPAYSHPAFRKLVLDGTKFTDEMVWEALPFILED